MWLCEEKLKGKNSSLPVAVRVLKTRSRCHCQYTESTLTAGCIRTDTHVLVKTFNLVISHCSFQKYMKEMY